MCPDGYLARVRGDLPRKTDMNMKSVMGTCLFGFILISGGAQKSVLRQGISVEMRAANWLQPALQRVQHSGDFFS